MQGTLPDEVSKNTVQFSKLFKCSPNFILKSSPQFLLKCSAHTILKPAPYFWSDHVSYGGKSTQKKIR